MNKQDSIRQVENHPQMIAYCKANFWRISCPDECPHYDLCRSLDYTDQYGTFPTYPMNVMEEFHGKP